VGNTDHEPGAEDAVEAAGGQGDDLVAPAAIGVAAASGAEDADGIVAAASGAKAIPRAATGTVAFWGNEYFFLSYHAQGIRIRVYQQRLSDEEMGLGVAAQSIRFAIYGEVARRCPTCTLVLRAWAVWRMAITGCAERRPDGGSGRSKRTRAR